MIVMGANSHPTFYLKNGSHSLTKPPLPNPHHLRAQGSPQHISPCFSEFKRLPSVLPSAYKKHSLTFIFFFLIYISVVFSFLLLRTPC